MALPGRDGPLSSKTCVSHTVQMQALALLRCHSSKAHEIMPEPVLVQNCEPSQVHGMYLA
jgi:hypothetical protein